MMRIIRSQPDVRPSGCESHGDLEGQEGRFGGWLTCLHRESCCFNLNDTDN